MSLKLLTDPISKGFRIFTRTFLVIAVFFTVINLFSYLSSKDDSPRPSLEDRLTYQQTQLYSKINDPKYNKPGAREILGLYKSFMCMFVGETCTSNPLDADKNFPSSILGVASSLILTPYVHPPASGVYFAYETMNNIGIVPARVYAAEGIGFGSLKPFLVIWKKFRDLAFLILVLILISIGFMIMFRAKLDAQTVIGIENALPKIIISMILITFSFAIAGFLIDIMYVLISLILSTVGDIANLNIDKLQAKYIQAGPDDITPLLTGNVDSLLGSPIQGFIAFRNIFWHLPSALLGLIGWVNIGTRLIGTALGLFYLFPFIEKHILNIVYEATEIPVGGVATPVGIGADIRFQGFVKALLSAPIKLVSLTVATIIFAAFGIPFILGIIILITVIMLFFKILFLLFSAYIKILLLVLLSPLILMFEAIPGKSVFSDWFKNLFVEILTFPLLIGIFMLGVLITDTASQGNLIKPPFLFGFDPGAFSIVVGMAFLFMTPDLITITKKLILPQPLPIPEAGPGVFFGGVTGAVSSGVGTAFKYSAVTPYLKFLHGAIDSLPVPEGVKSFFKNPRASAH